MGVDLGALTAMAVFSFVLGVSPGPNNTAVLTLSGRFGVKGAVPHLWGMVVGLTAMVVAMATGLGAFFATYPAVYEVLKYVGFAYVLYMAWGIYRAALPEPGREESPRGTTVVKASLFQLVNPKAWIVIATYVTAYVPAGLGVPGALVAAVVFVLATMPGAAVWVALGRLVGRFLSSPRAQKIFTTVMALALVASMIPALFI